MAILLKEVILIILLSGAISVLLPHIQNIYNNSAKGDLPNWRLLGKTMKNEFKTAKVAILLSMLIILLAVGFLWDDTRNNDVTKLKQQIDSNTQTINAMNDRIDSLTNAINDLIQQLKNQQNGAIP